MKIDLSTSQSWEVLCWKEICCKELSILRVSVRFECEKLLFWAELKMPMHYKPFKISWDKNINIIILKICQMNLCMTKQVWFFWSLSKKYCTHMKQIIWICWCMCNNFSSNIPVNYLVFFCIYLHWLVAFMKYKIRTIFATKLFYNISEFR